ncbi:hypothetical protein IEO21_00043 [Rhodonia placenta]|uniref:Pre-rRNA-processing protein n=1 Tax=Rhodonia placenta TaxID=104341 RepID=A0A8H7PBZ5_9APHY|nr:hypothetical protein IEO21_00043 [Postia placenta]
MPKSSKKKKDKAADFTKAKLKLGKGKQVPTNAVDTSFKARSIALPTQSIVLDKSSQAPTTKRKLTFDDLTSHLKHYNAATRRDAILGLRELLESYPGLIGSNLTALVSSCVRAIGDEDASVRKALLSFLGWLLRQVPPEDILPHSPVLLLFTTSAQTHIFPEIRIDAIRFLDLFLELIPDVVTEDWLQPSSHGRRVLEGYLGILNAGTTYGEGGDTGPVRATSTASVILSPASKLIVLKSLSSFLSHALSAASSSSQPSSSSSAHPPTPTWFLSSSFTSLEAYEAFESVLRPTYHASQSMSSAGYAERWSEEADVDVTFETFPGHFDAASAPTGISWSLQELMNVDVQELQIEELNTHELHTMQHLARTLHSTVVSTLLDCAPSVFSPSSVPPERELQMVIVLGEICRTLYGSILREAGEGDKAESTAIKELKQILGYLSPYFPFTVAGSVVAKRDIKVEQAFQDLNLVFCELTSFLILATSPVGPHPRHPQVVQGKTHHRGKFHPSGPLESSPPLQTSNVRDYVVQLLRGEASAGSSQSSVSRPITPAAYSALLPTIWSLLNSASTTVGADSTSRAVLRIVVEHAIKASSTSVVKRPTIDFLARLVLLERETEYRGVFITGRNSEEDRVLQEWLLHLPKTLWELGGASLPTTEAILRLLLRLTQRKSPLLPDETLSSLRTRLAPYFVISHATRGTLLGPYSKIPPASPLRRLVLDVVVTIISRGGRDGLVSAVDEAVKGTEEQSYWISMRR